jgi:hypothetical protein
MGLPSYMRSVIDGNVVVRRMTAFVMNCVLRRAVDTEVLQAQTELCRAWKGTNKTA